MLVMMLKKKNQSNDRNKTNAHEKFDDKAAMATLKQLSDISYADKMGHSQF